MIEHFLESLNQFSIQGGQSVLLTCSGGCDSMAMAALFAKTLSHHQCTLRLLHVQHGLRPKEETDQDIMVIQNLCEKYHLPLDIVHADPQTWRKDAGLEADARHLRYKIFSQVASQYRCDAIATAHTWDDHLETVYMRLMQKYSAEGLAGIPARRGSLIRPVLCFRKQELKDFLRQNHISWHEDSTNNDQRILRNRLRRELKKMQESVPEFSAQLVYLAQESKKLEKKLNIYMQGLFQHEQYHDQSIQFPLPLFLKQPPLFQQKLIYHWFDTLMRGDCPQDFRLPRRFVISMRFTAGPIVLRGYGIILRKKKNCLFFSKEAKNEYKLSTK